MASTMIIRQIRHFPSTSSRLALYNLHSHSPLTPSFNKHVRHMGFLSNTLDKMKNTFAKDKELRDKIENLEKQAKEFEESEEIKKAKEALEKAKGGVEETTTFGSQKIKESYEGLNKKIRDVFESASNTDFAKKTKEELENLTKESRKFTDTISEKGKEFSEKIEEKIEETTTKTPYLHKISETLKDAKEELLEGTKNSSRLYGGFKKAEERRRERERREKLFHDAQKAAEELHKKMEENPEAGSQIVLHKDSAWKESWNNFKENNPFMQRVFSLQRDYNESDNLLVHYMHRVQDSIAGLFAENEHASVIREIRKIDPGFKEEEFLKEMHDYIIPEVLEAYLHGNKKQLKEWCSEAAYSVLSSTIEEREKAGQHVDSRILDLKNIDLALAKMIDERPVLLITFNTQQITVIRDAMGTIIEGKEDDVESVHYVMAMLKESESNPFTGGWKVMELGIQASMKTW